MSFAGDLASLFRPRLSKLVEQVRAFPSDEAFWQTPPGVTNSAGAHTSHRWQSARIHWTAAVRELHSGSAVGIQREGSFQRELIARKSELWVLVPSIIASLSETQLEAIYPDVVFDARCPLGGFYCTCTGT